MSRTLHVRPSEGPCVVHAWPDEGLAAAIVLELRRCAHGLDICRDCLGRARRSHAASRSNPRSPAEARE